MLFIYFFFFNNSTRWSISVCYRNSVVLVNSAPMVRTPESQMAAVFTRALLLPQLARKGLIPPSEVLRFPASCLYPQLFVLSPLSCPLSPVPNLTQVWLCLACHTQTHTLRHCCGHKVLLATTPQLAFVTYFITSQTVGLVFVLICESSS